MILRIALFIEETAANMSVFISDPRLFNVKAIERYGRILSCDCDQVPIKSRVPSSLFAALVGSVAPLCVEVFDVLDRYPCRVGGAGHAELLVPVGVGPGRVAHQ